MNVSAIKGRRARCGRPLALVAALLAGVWGQAATPPEPPFHRSVSERFVPADVAWDRPVYATGFDDESALRDWRLEGGERMRVENGRLVLESRPGERNNHLVCWLTRELPAEYLLEFSMRPQNRQDGLTIVFFSTRGAGGLSVFDPALKARDGNFRQYHSSDLNGYHISYWAGERGTANVRKNSGFRLVASGPDLVRAAPADRFQVIRIYKRGGTIRLTVDDIVSVAFDDDGKTHGPVWAHAGWIGLRQMGHTVRCDYEYLSVYPLRPDTAK